MYHCAAVSPRLLFGYVESRGVWWFASHLSFPGGTFTPGYALQAKRTTYSYFLFIVALFGDSDSDLRVRSISPSR